MQHQTVLVEGSVINIYDV